MHDFVLTVAIPTYNRAGFLEMNLRQLHRELVSVSTGSIEIVVSDNASTDETEDAVAQVISEGLPVKYHKNQRNQGWGYNFFKCFDLSRGKYVLLLGDDDFLFDGVLKLIIEQISGKEYGVVFLKPYGFDNDFHKEYPGDYGSINVFDDRARFLKKMGPSITLLSACIINKQLISSLDTAQIIPGNFAHLHLILHAINCSSNNLYVGKYAIGSKRNNSSNYIFSKVFVTEFWQIMDSYRSREITDTLIRNLENEQLFSYYPYYLTRQRMERSKDVPYAWEDFSNRFGNRLLFRFWVAPIIKWPRMAAIAWGVFITAVGRSLNGDLFRGLCFLYKKITTNKSEY